MKIKQNHIIIIALAIIMSACTSTRRLPFKSFSLEPMTEGNLIEKIYTTENEERYTQISRFSAEYSGVQEQSSFKGFARIAQDSLMMLSLSPGIGGEAMRMLLSPDSSKIINRLESTYSETSYNAAQQMIPLPYKVLQALLSYHFSDLFTADYSLAIKDKMYFLENKKQKQYYMAFNIDGNYMVRKLYYKDFRSNCTVNVVYNTFQESDGKFFPQDVEITIKNSKEIVILRLSIKRVEFKKSLSFPFKVSSRYVRLNMM